MTRDEALNKLDILRTDLDYLRTELVSAGSTISISGVLTLPNKRNSEVDYEGLAAEYRSLNDQYLALQKALDSSINPHARYDLPEITITPDPETNADLAAQAYEDRQTEINTSAEIEATSGQRPFDPRLTRIDGLMQANGLVSSRTPYTQETLDSVVYDMFDSNDSSSRKGAGNTLRDDPNSYGVQSIVNPYSITRLYGGLSMSGSSVTENRLYDIRDQKRFYDVNVDSESDVLSVSNPTTTNLIRFGNKDKWGRTPYSFQDFVFCKYWNVIPNNRLITLRKYHAPCVDSLNFPGMEKGDVTYAPIATAVTYFGEGTDNSIKDILKFSTGMRWESLQSDVWEVVGEGSGTDQAIQIGENADGKFFASTLGYMAKLFALGNGDYDYARAMKEHGNLPPDPYQNGPYTNRLIGPANSIDSVYKRKRGLDFSMPLEIKFHYIARPIGGVNTKAAMLDILANLLVMGSASAMFWGGANRFMINPQVYPFFSQGGQSLLQKIYKGELWGDNGAFDQIKKAASSTFGGDNLSKLADDILGALGGMVSKIFSITGINGSLADIVNSVGSEKGQETGRNIIEGAGERIATKLMKSSIVPYMSGMRALLTGEPVGDWHLTIGNPLNPIAVIGNLICTGMNVEFGEELGPDDFPIEMTVTIKLDHGMPRDRDAIESMFNRGSGRIYNLPDTIRASSDTETTVDGVTGKNNPASQKLEGSGNGATWLDRHSSQVVQTAGSSSWEYKQKVVNNENYTALNLPKFTPLDDSEGGNSRYNIKTDIDSRSVFLANIAARKIGLT